jgi:SAM-dependent methyltransferase
LADLQGEALRRMEGAGAYNAWLFERVRPHLGRRVLDAGAGVGTFTGLAADGREVVAVEPDPELLPVLRARFEGRSDVAIVEGTIEDVSGSFDSIVCLNVLEHIADDVGTLRRFRELLEPGGRLLLLVPAHPSLYGSIDRTVEHERRYTKGDLGGKLREAGFDVAELRLVNPLGAAGWFVSSRVLKREQVPEGPLKLYDKLVPALRVLDKVDVGVGLSVWAVARRR